MIIWIMGILLIASFACFVFYAMRGGNLTVGFFILTIVWLAIYFLGVAFGVGQPFDIINDVFAQPALTYGPTIIQIVCGAWFGRVLVDTGIAASISYRTAKVGEKSPVLATIAVALVTCLIFTSAYGVGSAIAIGGAYSVDKRRDSVPDPRPSGRAQARVRAGVHPVDRRRHVDQQRDVRAVRGLLPELRLPRRPGG